MRSIARFTSGHRLIASMVGLVATVLALASALAFAYPGDVDPWAVLSSLAYWVVGSLGFMLIGSIILVQRPGHRIGRLMLLMGVSPALSQGGTIILGAVEPDGTRLGAITTPLLTVLDAMGFLAIVLGAVLLVVWFPDGRTTSRLGSMVVALVLILLISQLVKLLDPTVFGESELGFVLLLGTSVLALMDLLVRYRRSEGVRRTQIRWVLASGAVTAFLIVALLAFGERFEWLWPLLLASTILPAIAVTIAVTRYRLYEIDRVISRTIAYGAVTAVLGGVFVGIILGLQALLAPITNGQTIAVAASTLAVFALFQPVLRRVRGAVDRRFDRARYDADQTVRTFAARLRGDLDLGTVRAEIVGTASSAVRPTKAAVWLRGAPR